MKGMITRLLLNPLSRHTASLTPSPSSLLISRRSLLVSAATHFPANLLDNAARNPSISSSFPLNFISRGVQRRTEFIETYTIMQMEDADIPNSLAPMDSPLAKSIFANNAVLRGFFGSEDIVNVTKPDDLKWETFAVVMEAYSKGKPMYLDSQPTKDTFAISEDDSKTVLMIKQLLEICIKPVFQDHGGDIEYCGFDTETGIVKIRMQGACSGCPSFKSKTKDMLIRFLSEVKGVEEEFDGEEYGTSSGSVE